MDKVKEVYLNKLTLEDIEPHLPEGFQQQLLGDASQGHQPSSTFILGRVNESSDKVMWKGCLKKLMVLKEVITDDSEGKFIRVTLYKEYAESVDNILKKWGTSKRLWIALSDTEIGKYMGLGTVEKWCSLCLHAGYGGFLPQIWLFREGGAANVAGLNPLQTNGALKTAGAPLEKTYTYTPLMQCLIGNRYNVMAVVSEIVKKPSITRIGKLHMMLGILDPSSPDAEDTVKDILLNIFTVNTNKVQTILDLINAGDVVRLRGLKMEKYKDSLRANIFNENQLVLFPGGPDSDIVPYTVCSYSLTDSDKDKVKSLREWKRDNFSAFPARKLQPSSTIQQAGPSKNAPGNTARIIDPIFLYIKISEIRADRLFHLSCKVNMKQYLERDFKKLAILRVCDGTRTSKYFRKWDIDESSEEDEEEVCTPLNSEEVDILVFTNVDMLQNVNVGDFILLKNITCTPLETNANSEVTVYELSLKNEDSHIKKLKKTDQDVKDIKRALEQNTEERENVDDSDDSIAGLFQRADPKSTFHGKGTSLLKKSPNRIPCQPLSPPKSKTVITSGNPRTPRTLQRGERTLELTRDHTGLSSPKLPSVTDSMDTAMKNINSIFDGEKSGTLQRGERTLELTRDHTGLSSPKLPSVTDSMDTAMKNINSIFDGEKSGLSSHQSEAVVVTSTQVSSPARDQIGSPKANPTLKPGLKGGAVSPILVPASGSNLLVQANTDIHPQPGCSKWGIDNNDIARENMHSYGTTNENLSSHVHKPQEFLAAVRNSSFDSLPPLTPVKNILSEESSNTEMPVPLSSLSSHQPPYGEKSVERRTLSTKRKLILSEADKSAEDSYRKKHPRLIPDSDLLDSSPSKSETKTKGENSPKSNMLVRRPGGELSEPDTNMSVQISVKDTKDGTNELSIIIAGEEFKNKSSIKLDKKWTENEPSHASSSNFKSGNSLDPGNVQVMRKVSERARCDPDKLGNKTRSDGKELGKCGPVKKIPRLTTDISQKAVYSTICDVKNTNETEVTYRVPAYVVQVGISSNQPCTAEECVQGICFHDWIWGFCTVCKTHFESWQLRKQYSVEDLKSKLLPCSSCSKSRQSTICHSPRKSPRIKTVSLSPEKVSEKVSDKLREDKSSIEDAYKSKSVVPYMFSALILRDPDVNSNILVRLVGDDAQAFYGAEPTFEWLTNRADNPLRSLVSVLLKQKAPLWYGVQKYIRKNRDDYYLIRYTQLISGKLNDAV
ncbi:uncharacterized protein [Palaemon carinicauda]|uniref:uncharacterized protein isoform X2 n=1 Tax=Palaemon carinicauda TaxID=392227 RepID=UPI0035B600E0